MKITARLSIFDKEFRLVENPFEFFRAAKKRFGKPKIEFLRGQKIYKFLGYFDYLTIIVDRSKRHGYSEE